jgi:hypothetical protein
MKISNIFYQLWHIGFICLLLNGLSGTLKIGKGAIYYYFFALLSFIAGLIYYYFQISKHKSLNLKTVFIIVFFEFIIFLFAMINIFYISWPGGGSFG